MKGPPGSTARLDHGGDRVDLGTPRSATPERPAGVKGWRRAALLGLGVLSLGGAVSMLGPHLGPALVVAQQSPADQVVGMLSQPGLPAPTPEETKVLLQSLKPIDPGVISLLSRNGLKVEVVRPGQDLSAAHVLRDQSLQGFQSHQKEIRAFVTSMQDQAEQQFDGRLRQLEGERDRLAARLGAPTLPGPLAGLYPMGMGGGGFGGPMEPPKLTPDQEKMRDLNLEIGKLSAEKNGFVFTQTYESGLSLKPFTYPVIISEGNPFMGGIGGMAPMLAMQAQMPTTLQSMAQTHGAKTPEQFAEFYKLMELINGDRLNQARQAGVKQMAEMARLSGQPTAAVESASLKYPERVPLDHKKFNLLVPDMYYTRVGSQTMRLDEHDWGTVQRWTDPATGQVNTGRAEDGEPDGTMGQYFHLGGVNTVLVRDFRLGATTPVHEFGHALDYLVKKLDPTWHKAWYARVSDNFDQVNRGQALAITDYSRTNVGEYIGDGFLVYHTDPQLLKTRDPGLYDRIEELLGRARVLGSAPSSASATLGTLLEQIQQGDTSSGMPSQPPV